MPRSPSSKRASRTTRWRSSRSSIPKAEGKDLVYNYNVVKGTLPATGGETALFIDWIGVGGGVGVGFHGVGVGVRGPGVLLRAGCVSLQGDTCPIPLPHRGRGGDHLPYVLSPTGGEGRVRGSLRARRCIPAITILP